MNLDKEIKKLPISVREHLGDIIKRVVHDLTVKYVQGYLKHRGNLLKMDKKQLKKERRQELLDMICYEYTDED